MEFSFRDKTLPMDGRGYVMGIVNATPDSFYDAAGGGDFTERAVERALRLVAEGADMLDVGGESTRPGFAAVSAEEEIRRVVPVIREIRRRTSIPVSVDTMKAEVASAALAAGADILNDVTGLEREFEAKCGILRRTGAGCIVMHWRARPAFVTDDRYVFWAACAVAGSVRRAMAAAGLPASRFMADPGIGFGKTDWENLELLSRLDEFRAAGFPVLLGVSRKSFIQRATGRKSPADCLAGTAGATALGALGGVDVHRVHDVAEMRDVLAVVRAVRCHGQGASIEEHVTACQG